MKNVVIAMLLGVTVGLAGSLLPFSAFDARLEIETEDRESEFELVASFTANPASDGINPTSEEVTLKIGSYSVTFPPESFKQDDEEFEFEGRRGGVSLELEIRALGDSQYRIEAEGEGAHLDKVVSPVELAIIIGNDGGTTHVIAQVDDDDDDDDDEDDDD